jgi:two-component system CheB/CheR fusion protein
MAKMSNKQYIIAIGASSGGLEAISAFFDYTPLDGVSYILIQHLSADFKSQMAQILSRHTQLQVVDVTNDIKIESNKVYLIPSSNFMVIKNGKLILSDKKDIKRPHLTIDHFFTSLAKERGDRAIGVILSGTGRDGSNGIDAIKKAGGIAIVQDPATASFNEMPLAAIATGCADMVLSPEAMPQVIEDYVKDGLLETLADDKNSEITERDLAVIFGLIKGNLPLDFTDYKRPTILRRIKRRMLQHNFNQVAKYSEFLKNNPKEIDLLANDFLISVTSFFRDPEAFEIIKKTVIPDIVKQNQDDVLKVWVAGCATGEEAYSLAILISEYLTKTKTSLEVKIFATDINKAALDIASKGLYPESIEKDVSKERLQHFFTKTGTSYKVKHNIRKMLVFAQHDLAKNPPYCNISLISCRNLLIYMNLFLQKKVFAMMHFGLKKDGYLFLGPSENPASVLADFTRINQKWNILKSNKNGRSVRFDNFAAPVIDGIKTTTVEISKKSPAPVSQLALADEINIVILEESGFSGICTDENLTVLRSFGDPSPYLKHEIFNFNLNDLLPDNVALIFKAAAHKAITLNEKVAINGLDFSGDGMPHAVMADIIIRPFAVSKSAGQLLLILFAKAKDKTINTELTKAGDIKQLTKQHLISLEKELAEAKHNLGVAYERIESSNENMQSFNEELLSANEELQSANEELQSVNEELQTINKEHQVTNAELTESNDDLNNYFRSNINGQLFVDRDLLLKKYSPGAVKHINIRESDIGRPLSNITTNIKLETLIEDIKKVMANDESITREAESSDGRIYQVMTMPYIRKNSKETDGAVISFYEITELKKLLADLDIINKKLINSNDEISTVNHELLEKNEQLDNSRRYTEEIFNTIHDPVVILDKDLKVIRATEGFYHMFKVSEKQTEGAFLYDLGNKQWDIPVLRSQLENILSDKVTFKAFETDQVFKGIGRRIMRLTAREFNTHTDGKLIIMAIQDLTDKRKVEVGLAEAEWLLAESKERLHFAIESAGIGAWDFNPITRELIWDNRSRELFGLLPTDELDQELFLSIIHPDDRGITNEAIKNCLHGANNGEFNAEYRVIMAGEQKPRWIKSKGKAYFNKNQIATRFIGTVLDISIEKTAAENNRELLQKKDEFISIASHELKTPITTLKASLQLLSRMKESPKPVFPRLIEQSEKSMEKIIGLIDDLLNVTRLNEGQLKLNKNYFNIAGMLSQCCSHVRADAKHELIVQGDETLQIYADEDRIEQVVVNFVNNAVKYAPDCREIYLIIEKEDNMLKICVKDTGPGIPPEKQSQLFDRYYRADHSGSQYSGLGLGLYISAEIIKRHDGQIGVNSAIGKGTSFWFTLPL